MPDKELLRVACLQLNSGDERQQNLERTAALIGQAANHGCEMILLPENFSYMGASESEKVAMAETAEESTVLDFLSQQAALHGVVLIGGSTLLTTDIEGKLNNSCLVFNEHGKRIARYDKIHLFDIDLPEESHRESSLIQAGESPALFAHDGWQIGLSICYDLRFPELYRHYAAEGCNILTVPAAFMAATGKDHWQPLLKARAIENQCYLLASGQCGSHPGDRRTWGHSMIIDPWGSILAELADEPGYITADLSLKQLNGVRNRLRALNHRRM